MSKIIMRHIEGMRFLAETENHSIVLESDYLKVQKAPAPMEAFLMSLGGCTGMDVVAILKKMRAEPRKFEIYIDGERAQEHPKVYTKVRIKYCFEGTDYEKAKKAVELSQNRYCPVSAMLRRSGAEIEYEIEVKP
ncbi:osmotically inducible protein OsmC [Euryarchaeota archaeon ex4484_178]|nr:MAG: osmotically inducible protein OsmC [Euryarchaeota archaeon ex4484_178]